MGCSVLDLIPAKQTPKNKGWTSSLHWKLKNTRIKFALIPPLARKTGEKNNDSILRYILLVWEKKVKVQFIISNVRKAKIEVTNRETQLVTFVTFQLSD